MHGTLVAVHRKPPERLNSDPPKQTLASDAVSTDSSGALMSQHNHVSAPVSPEAAVPRNPQNGQALTDPSLTQGQPKELPDGGANAARHTGDDAKKP